MVLCFWEEKKNPVLPADRHVTSAALVRASKSGVPEATLSLTVQPLRCSCSGVTHLASRLYPTTRSIPILILIPSENIPNSRFFLLTPFSFPFRQCLRQPKNKATKPPLPPAAPAADQLTRSGTSLSRDK